MAAFKCLDLCIISKRVDIKEGPFLPSNWEKNQLSYVDFREVKMSCRYFMRYCFVLFFLFLCVPFPCRAESASEDFRLDVKDFTLDNGMLFLIVERHTTPQVACRVAIRAGSALEESGKTGIAHLLEHMMFKGTKNFGTLDPERDQELQRDIEAAYQTILAEEAKRDPDKDIIRKKLDEMARLRKEVQKIYVPQAFSSHLERNGAFGVNAFTSKDQTQFTMSVPSDMIGQWFSSVSEQIFEPSWREFYVEKEVVQREWAFRYINNPAGAAWLDLDATAYSAHPYRNPTIGWRSDMAGYNTTDAAGFHSRYYNPSNAVCVLVGDLTMDKARSLAEIYFGRYPHGKRAPERVTAEPAHDGVRRSIRYLKGARTPEVRIGFHAAGMGTKDFYALDALTMVLSQGRSSRIQSEILNNGLASSAWAYNPDNRYGGMFILGGSPNEPEELKKQELTEDEKKKAYVRACEKFEEILLNIAGDVINNPVTDQELSRIKKLNELDFLENMRSNETLAGILATLEVQTGWRYLNRYLEEIGKITPVDVGKAAEKYVRKNNMTVAYVIPGGRPETPPVKYEEIRTASGSALKRLSRPERFENRSVYPTPAGWKHPLSFERRPNKIEYPEAESFDISGARIFYLPDKELPLVDISFLIKAGSVDVEEAKTGLSELLDQCLIRGGTEDYGPDEFAEALDEHAVGLSFTVDEEVTTLRFTALKKEWKKGLELLGGLFSRPAFNADLLDVVKSQIVMSLKRQGGDADAVSARERDSWHFKGHPYGRDPLDGIKSIPHITRADLKEFHESYFVPSNMVIAVSGDIDRADLSEELGGLLSGLSKRRAPVRNLDEPKDTPPVLAFIDKPGQVQSQIRFVLPSVKRTDPDFWKINLLADIFGGSDSLLYTRLRDDLGLVYSSWFYQTFKWKAGILAGYIGCKGDKTSQAIEEMVRLMRSLRKKVPAEAVEQKRLDALNSFVFNVDSPERLVEVYAKYHMRKEPLDTLGRIQDSFLSAEPEKLKELAQRFLNPDRLQIFIVADGSIPTKRQGHEKTTLRQDLVVLSTELGLPFKELALR